MWGGLKSTKNPRKNNKKSTQALCMVSIRPERSTVCHTVHVSTSTSTPNGSGNTQNNDLRTTAPTDTTTNLLATPTRQEGVGAGTFRLACCPRNASAGTHFPPLEQPRCPLGLHQDRCRGYFPLWQIRRRRSCCCRRATREQEILSRPGQPAPYIRVERGRASVSE